jgi:hypothetical protein
VLDEAVLSLALSLTVQILNRPKRLQERLRVQATQPCRASLRISLLPLES